jgi:2-polyprenyl-6-methoxyphenol hydroxylase-like FAD-dependent oxidoreductase
MTAEGSVDALVVGGGPVGMTMAWELRRHGVACRIVEKAAARTDKSKALVLWSRSLEMLHAMGGVAPFLEAGMEVHGASLWGEGRRLLHLGFGGVDSPYPFALMIPQSETERLLEAKVASLGAPVERRVELAALAPADDAVDATLRHADGREERVRTPWLLACDGAHSTVRHALGVPFAGDAEPNDWILADVHVKGSVPDDEVSAWFHPSGILVFFPIAKGRYRVIADQGFAHGMDHPPDPTLAQVQALVDERGPGGIALSDPVWLAGFRIHERKVGDYRAASRVFLAGDAAHIHSPAGGQGMNTGMQDAFNLAWKLALVQRGRGRAEPLLASYDAERGAVGKAVLRAAGLMTRIGTLRHPLAQHVRNRAYRFLGSIAAVQDHAAALFSELAVHYADSPLSGEHRGRGAHGWLLGGGVPPGRRLPDRELSRAGSDEPVHLLDLLRTPVHRVLLLAGAAEGAAAPEALSRLAAVTQAVVQRFAGAVAMDVVVPEGVAAVAAAGTPCLVDRDASLHRILGAALPTLVLARPDGYVGFRSQPADAAALAAHLERYLVAP